MRPEDFGAKGDGVANDTEAFAAMSAHVNRLGGGTIILRQATYLVGLQAPTRSASWSFEPSGIMEFHGLTRELTISGNGARLKCAPDLRFGAFDSLSGASLLRIGPNYALGERATPYLAMIKVMDCHAPLEIADLELDGSLPELRIGGQYGDTGRQIPATGLFLGENHSSETIRNLHTHHHALDGITIDGDPERIARSRFENVVSEFNGRQGASLVGGRGYDFFGCKFNSTGRSTLISAPGAGVDIEAEGSKQNRDLTFTDCEFSSNSGPGMVADSGDSANVTFTRCTFVGTKSWSAWPNKPRFRFDDCVFVGSLAHAYSAPDPVQAAQFHHCAFDDRARSGDRTVYLGGHAFGSIADLDIGENVLFEGCDFNLTSDAQLPWSVRAIYRACTMNQTSIRPSYPRGTFAGRTVINGNAVLSGSTIVGEVILNGRRLPEVHL